MAEEDSDLASYKDISELKRELEGVKIKKDVSNKELYDAVQRLTQTMSDVLDIFGAAAEQIKLEEKEYESEAKKHEAIISKLDKLIDQNKTIAEGMVAIVEIVREKPVAPAKEKEEFLFKPRPEPKPFASPPQPSPQPEWRPRPEPIIPREQSPIPPLMPQHMARPAMPPPLSQPSMALGPNFDIGMPEYGLGTPPLEPAPSPDLDYLEEPKKKGLFGMFKK